MHIIKRKTRPYIRKYIPQVPPFSVKELEHGTLFLHQEDKVMTPYITEHCIWERHETKYLEEHLKPGMLFVDVEANTGYHTLLASKLVGAGGEVVAIEPNRENFALLKLTSDFNRLSNVTLYNCANGDRQSTKKLFLNDVNRGDHSLGPTPDHHLDEYEEVAVTRLDDFNFNRGPDLIKIDTQGAEPLVLDGAKHTLSLNPDLTMIIEFYPPGIEALKLSPLDLLTMLRGLGFGLKLLPFEGEVRAVNDQEILQECATNGHNYVDLVVARPNSGISSVA